MDWTLFLIFFGACCAAAATGALFQPGEWYESLDKPSWTPPDWVFPVTWTILYIAIAVAAARVAKMEGAYLALAFWSLQIALNTLWTPIFFGLRRLKAGMIVIVALWVAVAGCLWTMMQLDTIAALLFAPYLVWVTIASALNFSVMQRNPDVEPIT
ncbi:tryptophan-rich sensory protein TspO [Litoreibacter roseus]|uniref:Sensory protein TspO n=1 Tax=Litoreibacter roseus TaxID=2601869 RepID=A0A6N6JEG9_9RHOB|nr:TspO/MBR family protein [Litoreibacter roseus]GFE64606.1 sensory protein TspO [Litoreibacter roseus]